MSLLAKNKLGFVDGSCVKPVEVVMASHWERCNNMVMSWLIHSVEKNIAETILFRKTAKAIWDELRTRFSRCNRTRLFQVQRELTLISQGNLTITVYFGNLTRLWDEYIDLIEITTCTCGDSVSILLKFIRDQQIMQFLCGLNESYDAVKATILLKSPTPELNEVYHMLLTEESQRNLKSNAGVSQDSMAFAAGKGFNNYRQNWNPNPGAGSLYGKGNSTSTAKGSSSLMNSGNGRGRPICEHCGMTGHKMEKCYKIHGRPVCTHCGMTGHSVEKCYKIHGYPTERGKANAATGESAGSSNMESYSGAKTYGEGPLTQEQYNQIISLLSKHNANDQNVSTTAFLAGKHTCLISSNLSAE